MEMKKGVIDFNILNGKVFYLSEDNVLFLNDKKVCEGEISFFGVYNECQIVFEESSFKTYLYDVNGKLVEVIEDYGVRNIHTFSNNNSLIGGNDGDNIFYGIYNFSDNTLLKSFKNLGFNGIYKVINDELFISQNNEKFGVFNFDNKLIWEICYKDLFVDYESIGAGKTNILILENYLYIELDKTYCIDIITGNLIDTYSYKFTVSENEFLYGLQFLSMKEFQLVILNTKTKNIEIIDLSEEFNRNDIYPDNRIIIDGGLVYFSQNMGSSISKIGVLDPKSSKILWKYDFENNNGMIGRFEVNNGRVYAHTQDKILHIFEKETTPTDV